LGATYHELKLVPDMTRYQKFEVNCPVTAFIGSAPIILNMNLVGRGMKIGGKYAAVSVGVFFIAFAIVSAIIIVSSASEA
jgi:hypothetical protein